MRFRPTPTIANNVFAVTLILLVLMTGITVVGAVMSTRVGSLITAINETYLPAYGMLARAHIRLLEQSLLLRRAVIERLEGKDTPDLARILGEAATAAGQADDELSAARAAFARQAAERMPFDNPLLLG